MIAAVRPWVSIDASDYMWSDGKWVRSDLTTYDDQDQIEFCMTCPFADECHDCLTVGRKARRSTNRDRNRKTG